jgi:uncharacterized membrane protein HdeD (DUF308 family)
MSLQTMYARRWREIALRGVAAVIFGLLLLFWPAPTLLTLVYIFGIFVLVEGVAALIGGLRPPPSGAGRSGGLIALGLIGIAAGIATLVWPGITGLLLVLLIGFWAIAAGIVEIIDGFRLRQAIENEWLLIATGIVSLFFGLILVIAPVAGALAVAFFIGFFGLIYGVLQLLLAFRLRSVLQGGAA